MVESREKHELLEDLLVYVAHDCTGEYIPLILAAANHVNVTWYLSLSW